MSYLYVWIRTLFGITTCHKALYYKTLSLCSRKQVQFFRYRIWSTLEPVSFLQLHQRINLITGMIMNLLVYLILRQHHSDQGKLILFNHLCVIRKPGLIFWSTYPVLITLHVLMSTISLLVPGMLIHGQWWFYN